MTRVTVLGTGLMGAGIARTLLRAGFDVTVWNRSRPSAEVLRAAGARVASSAADAVVGADAILIVVFDAASVLEVLDAAAPADDAGPTDAAAPSRAVWVQMATIGAAGSAAVRARARERGLELVETMIMGSKAQAEVGRLILLGGGPEATFGRLAPVLGAISQRLVVAGPDVGAGTALKLACNAWIATITAGAAQSIALARAQGLDPQLFLSAIIGGTSDSPYAHLKGDKVIAGDYSPQFAVAAIRKDLDLIREAADRTGVAPELLDTLQELYRAADASGHPGDDIAAVYEAFAATT